MVDSSRTRPSASLRKTGFIALLIVINVVFFVGLLVGCYFVLVMFLGVPATANSQDWKDWLFGAGKLVLWIGALLVVVFFLAAVVMLVGEVKTREEESERETDRRSAKKILANVVMGICIILMFIIGELFFRGH